MGSRGRCLTCDIRHFWVTDTETEAHRQVRQWLPHCSSYSAKILCQDEDSSQPLELQGKQAQVFFLVSEFGSSEKQMLGRDSLCKRFIRGYSIAGKWGGSL